MPQQNLSKCSARAVDISKAERLFEAFTGHSSDNQYRLTGLQMPKVACVVGELDALLYTTMRDGKVERYTHTFNQRDKAILCASPDGRQILILGGHFRWTARGIVDRHGK